MQHTADALENRVIRVKNSVHDHTIASRPSQAVAKAADIGRAR